MKRVASIDIYRALTMFSMLVVNDFAGITGLPYWFYHAKAAEDMMGLSDLVFPSFLFCVGLSLPFAIEGRFAKGQSVLQVVSHLLSRSLALIVMGLFSMNCSGIDGGMSHQVFSILMVAGFFLVWNVYPRKEGRKSVLGIVLQLLGALLLVALVAYRLMNGKSIRIGWWGILGLIGWAYLICSIAYLLIRGKKISAVLAWVLFAGLMIAQASGAGFLGFYPGGWTHPMLVFSGVLVSVAMGRFGDEKRPGWLVGVLLSASLLMFAAGNLCHNFWICSKIMGTPTWAFWSVACFLPLLALLYFVCDACRQTGWARPIAPAGTATLTCYMVPTLWYSTQQLLGLRYPAMLYTGWPGFAKSLVFAMAIILVTWCLGKLRIKLKV